MKNRINEFQVGILTVTALAVLIGGMMWFKNVDLSKGQNFFQADFTNVAGLREGDKVQVRGIRMGEVTGMQILQGSVRVEIQLDDTVDLREDAVITLGEKGIVGEVVIEIDPGSWRCGGRGAYIPGEDRRHHRFDDRCRRRRPVRDAHVDREGDGTGRQREG